MMGPPKPIGFEQPIGVADKVAIGEEEQFDQFVHRLVAAAGVRGWIGPGRVGRHR